MALPSSGAISLSQIAGEIGGSTPHSLSEYYGTVSGVPSSGAISFSNFRGKSNAVTITYLIVGGGGGGGPAISDLMGSSPGAGGAGGVVATGTYTITSTDTLGLYVGAGGGGGTGSSYGGTGGQSSFIEYGGGSMLGGNMVDNAPGGGRGASWDFSPGNGGGGSSIFNPNSRLNQLPKLFASLLIENEFVVIFDVLHPP